MSQILNSKIKKRKIYIYNFEFNSHSIKYDENNETKVMFDNKICLSSKCLNCINPKCLQYESNEVKCNSFNLLSCDTRVNVCPVGAMSNENDQISINSDKCIGCGLCVKRCPVGALFIGDGKANLNRCITSNDNLEEYYLDCSNEKKLSDFFKKLTPNMYFGCIRKESDNCMNSLYKNLEKLTSDQLNLLVRNILIELCEHASLARKGVVYNRMDGYYETGCQSGVLEIETGSDMLDVTRAILDDVAVANSRYNISPKNNSPLAIVLSLPNKRTDFWQVIKDIRLVTKIRINTLSIGALLILLWNNVKILSFDSFYVDSDNSSIRPPIELLIKRNATVSIGKLGILENSK